MLIAVDDAQWLDAPTARLLEFVVRRLEAEPLRILTAARPGATPAATFDRAVAEARRRLLNVGTRANEEDGEQRERQRELHIGEWLPGEYPCSECLPIAKLPVLERHRRETLIVCKG